jgi:hypothetical protein
MDDIDMGLKMCFLGFGSNFCSIFTNNVCLEPLIFEEKTNKEIFGFILD